MKKRQLAVVGALMASLILATACGSSGSKDGDGGDADAVDPGPMITETTEVPMPAVEPVDVTEVDRDDPEQVAVAALEAIYTWAPADDNSAADAYGRAAPLLSDRMAAIADWDDGPTGPSMEWQQWASNGNVITAEAWVDPQEHPEDGEQAMRYMVVEQTVHRGAGTKRGDKITLLVSLVQSPDGWVLDMARMV